MLYFASSLELGVFFFGGACNTPEIMEVLCCALVQWLGVYNHCATQSIVQFLGRQIAPRVQRDKSIILITPAGAVIKRVCIRAQTTAEDITHGIDSLYFPGAYDTPLRGALYTQITETCELVYRKCLFQGVLCRTWACVTHLETITWNPTSTTLAGGSEGMIYVWDSESESKSPTSEFHVHGECGEVYSIKWDPAGTHVGVSTEHNAIQIWDVEAASRMESFQEQDVHHQWIGNLAWHPNGQWIATAGHDTSVRILDAHTGLELFELNGHMCAIYALRWSPDGTMLASASDDRSIRIWRFIGTPLMKCDVLYGHILEVNAVAWHPEGTILASGSTDGTVHLWDIPSSTCRQVLKFDNNISSVSWNPSGTLLACAGKVVYIWNMVMNQSALYFNYLEGCVDCVSWSPCGTKLAGLSNGRIHVWR